MTNLPGNPYQSIGQETLALAYEQHTASLIAYTALSVQIQLSGLLVDDEMVNRGKLIEDRLGLEVK